MSKEKPTPGSRANPPFMSPKGGIRPHNRFSIQAKRSEVLFVDCMAEHLTPDFSAKGPTDFSAKGAAPCQPGATPQENAPQDGKGLKARPISRADDGTGLQPSDSLVIREPGAMPQADMGCAVGAPFTTGLIVPKEKIAANGDYNLSGERYREGAASLALKWPLVPIGDLCVIERGASPRPIHDFITDAPDGVNWIKIGDAEVGAKYITATKEKVTPEGAAKSRRVKPGDFILSNSMIFGRPYVMATDGCIHDGWLLLRDQSDLLDQDFLYNILGSNFVFAQFKQAATGGVVNNLNSEIVRGVKIPLPPFEVQKEIVAEIEGYQNEIERLEAEIANQEENIQRSIARVWGEDSESANGAPPSQPGATPPVSNPKHHEG